MRRLRCRGDNNTAIVSRKGDHVPGSRAPSAIRCRTHISCWSTFASRWLGSGDHQARGQAVLATKGDASSHAGESSDEPLEVDDWREGHVQ